MGLFDIGAPLFTSLHGWVSPWISPAAEIAAWALLCAWASMSLYRLLSNQHQLAELKVKVRRATLALAAYDGDFSGVLSATSLALSLTFRQVWLTLMPALMASLPVLFVLTWLSNTFEHVLPEAGQSQMVTVLAPANDKALVTWSPAIAAVQTGSTTWKVTWPQASQRVAMRDQNGVELLILPLTEPIPIRHKHVIWNWLIGNPIGYLSDQSSIDGVEVPLPIRDILNFGPPWLRGWLTLFLVVLVSCSLWLKVRWRLH